MKMIPTPRRAHAAPAAYAAGGDLHGMIAQTVADVSPVIAKRAENLIRRTDGALVKRPGLRFIRRANIAGQVEREISYAGATLTLYEQSGAFFLKHSVCGTRAVGASCPLDTQFGDKLLLLCEREWLIFSPDGTVMSLTDGGYTDIHYNFPSPAAYQWDIRRCVLTVPTLRAGAAPSGGGALVDPPNMLCPHVRESFTYTESDRTARRNRFEMLLPLFLCGEMPSGGAGTPEGDTRAATMNASAVLSLRVVTTDADGNTVTRWQTRSFVPADNVNGNAVWLNNIHNEPLAFDGKDNVRLTYFRDWTEAQADFFLLSGCRTGTLFGVGGFKDRLFLSGCGDAPGRIWYSGMDDMFYFGTQRYITVGGGTPVRQMAGQDIRMTVLGDDTAFTVAGAPDPDGADALFTVSAASPAPGPLGKSEPLVCGGEIVYLSRRGVCAVTDGSPIDERRAEIRSKRLDGVLTVTEDTRMATDGDLLLIARGQTVFALDLARRRKATDDPYTRRVYEAYLWTLPLPGVLCKTENGLGWWASDALYLFDETLCRDEIATLDGEILSRPVAARWETHPMQGKGPYICTRFFAVTAQTEGYTALRVSVKEGDRVRLLRDYDGRLGAFRYAQIYYGQWCYRTVPRAAARFPLPLHHRKGVVLLLENDVKDQPLTLVGVTAEYK